MKLGYIIGPFTADTAWEIEQNVRNAEALAFEVRRFGAFPVTPHANTRFFHGLATPAFWYEGTRLLMERCADFAITVEALGFPWKHSRGSVDEVEYMTLLDRPVFHSLRPLKSWLERFLVEEAPAPQQAPCRHENVDTLSRTCLRCGKAF